MATMRAPDGFDFQAQRAVAKATHDLYEKTNNLHLETKALDQTVKAKDAKLSGLKAKAEAVRAEAKVNELESELANLRKQLEEKWIWKALPTNCVHRIDKANIEPSSAFKRLTDVARRGIISSLSISKSYIAVLELKLKIDDRMMALDEQLATIKTCEDEIAKAEDENIGLKIRYSTLLQKQNAAMNMCYRDWEIHRLAKQERNEPSERSSELETKLKEQQQHLVSELKTTTNELRKYKGWKAVMWPLYLVGVAVRTRKLEQSKVEKNHPLIAEGNAAAHDGSAFADAALYRETHNKGRTDVETFKMLYGVEHSFVWERQLSKAFLSALGWRGSLDHPAYGISVSKAPAAECKTLCDEIMKKGCAWTAAEFDAYLEKSEEGKAKMARMKTLSDKVLEEFRRRR